MIDWKSHCLQLARLVNQHDRERLISDKRKAWELAKIILEMSKMDDEAWETYMRWWKEPNKKEAEQLINQYIEMIREINDLSMATREKY